MLSSSVLQDAEGANVSTHSAPVHTNVFRVLTCTTHTHTHTGLPEGLQGQQQPRWQGLPPPQEQHQLPAVRAGLRAQELHTGWLLLVAAGAVAAHIDTHASAYSQP